MNPPPLLQRFFGPDGRTLLLPIDHGTGIPVPGLEHSRDFIRELNPWVDGYVANYGVLRLASDAFGAKPVCLRTDLYKAPLEGNERMAPRRLYGAPEARRLGASAVMNMLYPHHPGEGDSFATAAALISESHACGLPVILEALPFGLGRTQDHTPAHIGYAVRAAAELGADAVKTAFPTGGTTEDFQRIVEAALVPVVVLGGAPDGDDVSLLRMARQAMDAGAAGLAAGRRIWRHPQPVSIARALHAILHEDASVSSAMKLL